MSGSGGGKPGGRNTKLDKEPRLTWKEFTEKCITVVPDITLRPGQSLLTSDRNDPSKTVMITNLGDDGVHVGDVVDGKIISTIETNDEDYYLHLVIQLVHTARHNDMDKYKEVKKEIKQLMKENKEAKKFFQTAFAAVK